MDGTDIFVGTGDVEGDVSSPVDKAGERQNAEEELDDLDEPARLLQHLSFCV